MKPTNSIMILDIPDSIALEDIELHFNTLSESLGIPKPASINLVKAIKIAYVIFPTINSASEVFNALNENVSICGFSLQFDYAPTNSENSQQKFLSRTEWYCPKCDAYNFANRSKCYKCKFPRHSLRDPDHSELPAKEEENINATIMAKGSIVSVCDEETIFNTFAKFGKVKDVRKIRDRLSGDFRDIAFIEFYSINDADMTLEISGNSPITIEGCPITISKSRKRKTETFSQFPSNPDYGYGIPIFHTPTQIIVPQALKTLSGYEYKIPSHYAFDESCQLYYDTHTKYYWDPKTNKFMKASREKSERKTYKRYDLSVGKQEIEEEIRRWQKQQEEKTKIENELEKKWEKILQGNVAVCFLCKKWFDTPRLAQIHAAKSQEHKMNSLLNN